MPEPTHAGTVAGCLHYAKAEAGDTCLDFTDGEMLTEAQFFDLNPGLDNNCQGLWTNYCYCMVGPAGILNYPSPTTTVKPTPTPSGQGSNCVRWFKPSNLDCATIASSFGFFSEALFITLNPSVGLTCKNIRADSWYCIGIPTTGSTRTTPLVPQAPATTDTSASFPTQTGVASGCQKWWFVSKSDTCDRITYIHDLTMADFLAMNPSVSTVTNQCGNLVPYVYVCVAVGGVPTTSRAAVV